MVNVVCFQLVLDFETKDAPSIQLKIDVLQQISRKCSTPDCCDRKDDMSLWGTTQVTLDKVLKCGHKGLEIPLALEWELPVAKYATKHIIKMLEPGTIFLRAEVLSSAVFGVSGSTNGFQIIIIHSIEYVFH
jgi:Zn ribbon nucleic-acid-binding protein